MPSSSSAPYSDGPNPGAGIGIPQLAACLLLGYLFFRWYSSGSSSTPSPPPTNNPTTGPRATRGPTQQELARLQQRAEVVHGMFPQISMNAIRWELQRNGGSVEVATEKILANGFLPEPPAHLVPPTVSSSSSSSATTPAGTSRSRTNTPRPTANPTAAASPSSSSASQHPDLITRYNLSTKLASTSDSDSAAASTPGSTGKSPAWSTNKAERQALLRSRREEMILNARRKMEEKDREEKEKAKEISGKGKGQVRS